MKALFGSSLRCLKTFECHCVLLCPTLLRRKVTELSNLCGLAQAQAVKKNRGAASCVLEAGWHLVTFAFVLRGRRRMPLRWLWWRAWAGLVTSDAAALCVAGVLRFAWQAWNLATFAFVSRGRRGTGVAFGDIRLRFT